MAGRIFHIATRDDWEQARRSGSYTTSTLGRTLEEEGFIHASHRDQVAGVFDRYYRAAGRPLVLLTIAPERLRDAQVKEEQVDGVSFPHIYGPINAGAVVAAQPLGRDGRPQSFAGVFFLEMVRRIAIAVAVMLCSVVGSWLAGAISSADPARFVGAIVGLLVGVAVAALGVSRARRATARPPHSPS